MKRIPQLLSAGALALLWLTGCEPRAQTGRGFALPEGSVERGKTAFIELKCTTCHRVDGLEDLPPPSQTVAHPVLIGGEVAKVRSYGDLVTAIIHPSHRITGQLRDQWETDSKLSPMPMYNEIMTVQQMIDLATFLQPRYRMLVPLYDPAYYP
jgi:hypothetical protein